jgi:membrane protease YdiL (CAAX protease family)
VDNEIVMPPPSQPVEQPLVAPPWYGRWMLFSILFGTYFIVQLVVAIPFIFWLMAANPGAYTDPDSLMQAPLAIWGTLIAAAVGGSATGLVAWAWPRIWRIVSDNSNLTGALWVAWVRVERIPLWLVVIITAPLVFLVSAGVTTAMGPSEVDLQLQLFTSPARQIVASLVVSTVVPLAEELIFRGGLYGALLPASHYSIPKWTDHILPILITTPLFSLVHLLGGFETLPPFIAIGLLSLYLGLLRAITGSVKASIVGHMTWNLIGAIFITLSYYIPAQ